MHRKFVAGTSCSRARAQIEAVSSSAAVDVTVRSYPGSNEGVPACVLLVTGRTQLVSACVRCCVALSASVCTADLDVTAGFYTRAHDA
jgi:hypothetical protein